MIGLLYDVHGNLPALEAVLADARETGAERFVLGGDYAAFGAWPGECVELRWVEYDWQASADAIRDRLGEAGEMPARRIEQARFDVG